MNRTIEIYAELESLSRAATERFVALAGAATSVRGRFAVALSGGSTPRLLYELLSNSPYVERIDWSRTHVFWGDERCVGPDDARSNYRMAREALLDHVPLPESNVHRIRGEIDPNEAAADYEHTLRNFFQGQGGNATLAPAFDLVLLGMGDDGHTASLFPGTQVIDEQRRWVAPNWVEKVAMWRITLTPPVLNDAHDVMFLVAGADKATRLQQVLEGAFRPHELPSQVVQPPNGNVHWMIDAAAATKLEKVG
jgi:6-phosphogluconolactonase